MWSEFAWGDVECWIEMSQIPDGNTTLRSLRRNALNDSLTARRNSLRITSKLLRSTVVGALGGLLFGFDTVVISGAMPTLTELFHLTPAQQGITTSIALWGTVVGCFASGPLGQKLGGRNALRVMALLYIVSAFGCALSPAWFLFLAFRAIGGLAIGGSSVLGPVYIAELAPASWRGRLVGAFQFNIVLGILIAYVSNWYIAKLALGLAEWRWQIGVSGLPAIFFFVMLFTIPHSSRFLITRNSHEDALAVLRDMGADDPDAELAAIRASIHQEAFEHSVPVWRKSLRLPLFLAISIGFFNQVSGINAILYNSNRIFELAGMSRMTGFSQSIFLGLSNLLATFVAMTLIDKLGRKTLLLIGAVMTTLCLVGVGHSFASGAHLGSVVWLLVAFIFFFALSQGAVIWVYISEVFPTEVRSKGQSIGAGSHWVMAALITQYFPVVVASVSPSTPFYFFAAMTVIQLLVVLFVYPETKGKTLEQLQAQLEK